jgi:hypothetical protein
MSFVFPTNASQVQAFAGALFGVQVGSATLAQVNADILANGGLAKTLNGFYSATQSSTAVAAKAVATNLGLTGAALTEGTAYVTSQLNAAAADARGAVISNIVNMFGTYTADATFGAAATAWNTKLAAAVAYTGATNVAIGTVVVANAVFPLTVNADSFTGGAGSDTVTATHLTLGIQDNLAGGAGVDTLKIVNTGTVGFAPAAASITGFENVVVQNLTPATTATNEAVTVTFQALGALQTVIIGGRTITAAATGATAVEVASAFATGATVGGANYTAGGTAGSGALSATLTAAASSVGAGNSVVITESSGTNVTDLVVTGTANSGIAAVARTIVIPTATAINAASTDDTFSFTYNGVTLTTGVLQAALGAGVQPTTTTIANQIAAAINSYVGTGVAVVSAATAGTNDIVTVSAPFGTAIALGPFVIAGAAAGTAAVGASAAGVAGSAAIAAAPPTVSIVQGAAAGGTTDTITATRFTDATSFTNEASSSAVSFASLVAGQTVTTQGASTGAVTAAWGSTVTAPVLNVKGAAGAVTLTNAGGTNITINSSDAALTSTGAVGTNTIGALNAGGAANATLNITAASSLSTGSTGTTIFAGETIKASGAGSVSLGTLTAPALKTIDASGLAGGMTATLVAGVTSFKGGAGNDVITSANVATTSSIDAGAGTTDVLKVAAYADIDTLAEARTFANFERIDTGILTGTTVDLALFTTSTGITSLASGISTAPAFSNVTAAAAANIIINGNQATSSTYGVINATQVGQIDTMNVTISSTTASATSATPVGIAALTAPGVEIVNINNGNTTTFSALTGLPSLTSSTITGVGPTIITTGALAANVNSNINASANTGGLTWDSQAATANGFAVTGSATKANVFTGARALADVFVGGSLVDTFNNAVTGAATTGGDIFTGGAGADIFNLRGNVASGVASTVYQTAPRITDFSVGTGGDVLQLSATVANYTGATGNAGGIAGAVAAGTTTLIQTIATNSGTVGITTGAAMLKLTGAVVESASLQTMFNAAIGTSIVTVGAGTESFFSIYDQTNSRMVVGQVESAGGTGTQIETADVVTLIGTLNMSAADYALFSVNNLGIIAA